MRFKASLATAACALSALGLAACSSSPSPSESGSSGGSSGSATTLTMEQSPTGPVADNMNPFSSTGAGNLLGFTNMIYDPLMQFDLLKPGTSYPWLATNDTWSNGGKTITFTLRSGVKFTNGEAFNASTAAWEFNYLKKNAAINTNGLPIASASAPNPTTLVINFTQPAYTDLYFIANTPMIPQGVWSKVSNPATYADTNPVGTGPYKLKSFSPQNVVLTRNTSYWQGESKVPNLDYPAYTSNTTANQALETGSLQWAGNFVQNIQSAFVNKSPHNHYWDYGLQTETLIPNLTRFPFNNGKVGLAVRQAISYAVNRQQISSVGEDNQQPPVQGAGSLTGLTLPLDQQYVTPETSGYVATQDVNKAKQVLEAAGWKKGANGIYAYNGKPLSFSIEDPGPYTDFITDANIMIQQLKAVGINASLESTSVQKWTTDLGTGNFDSVLHWGNSGTSPYYLYDNWMDTTLMQPIGKTSTGDFEHFNNAQAEADLKALAGVNPSDTATQKKYIVDLEKIEATQLPVVPLFYGVAWFEYNDSQWTGWPSQSDPYAPGEPSGPWNENVVLHLRPAH